jgi:hypothetical protein
MLEWGLVVFRSLGQRASEQIARLLQAPTSLLLQSLRPMLHFGGLPGSLLRVAEKVLKKKKALQHWCVAFPPLFSTRHHCRFFIPPPPPLCRHLFLSLSFDLPIISFFPCPPWRVDWTPQKRLAGC